MGKKNVLVCSVCLLCVLAVSTPKLLNVCRCRQAVIYLQRIKSYVVPVRSAVEAEMLKNIERQIERIEKEGTVEFPIVISARCQHVLMDDPLIQVMTEWIAQRPCVVSEMHVKFVKGDKSQEYRFHIGPSVGGEERLYSDAFQVNFSSDPLFVSRKEYCNLLPEEYVGGTVYVRLEGITKTDWIECSSVGLDLTQ